ncbi:hypothetical protein LINPERHAP1_LOCUS5741 [Linum perenne]
MFCSNVFFRIHHLRILHKSCVISSLVVLLLLLTFRSKHALFHQSSDLSTSSATNISHIGFIVVTSLTTWKHRRPYTDSWWRPNVTRGYVFFDQDPSEFLPWPSTSPPFKINEDITKLQMYKIADKDLRWLVMCDDDTFFFLDNLIEVLGRYDHTKFHYIGGQSECFHSNAVFSFDMGFGGAGYALSYPLVEALAPTLDACVARYPNVYASDLMASSCLADIGVPLTVEKGFHQIDLHGDISGLLSSHPQSPALTLHHFHEINPIFPSIPDRFNALRHLTRPAKFTEQPGYIMNTRWMLNDPCDTPHVFFFESLEHDTTSYVRGSARGLPTCGNMGSYSGDQISLVRVKSSATARKKVSARG